MALSINRLTSVIFVPRADLIFLSGDEYRLDINAFRKEVKAIEATEGGMAFITSFDHNPTITIPGAGTGGRSVIMVNGYTVEFEGGLGFYSVELDGANTNIAAARVINEVSIASKNTFGLIQVTSGSGLSVDEQTKLDELWRIHGLKAGEDLEVSETARSAGSIAQTITNTGSGTTVSRP